MRKFLGVAALALLTACGGGSGGGTSATPVAATLSATTTAAAPAAAATTVAPATTTAVQTAAIAQPPIAIGTSWTESATRDEFNGAFGLQWSRQLGDLLSVPLGTATILDVDRVQTIRIPVSGTGTEFAITTTGGSAEFASREAADAATRPALIVNGTTRCAATRDTWLSASTSQPLGARTTLGTLGTILLGFDGCPVRTGDALQIELTSTDQQFGGTATLTVMRPDAHLVQPTAPVAATGTAADVVLRIEGDAWRTAALSGSFLADRNTVSADGSLSAFIPTGGDTGTAAIYTIPVAARTGRMFLRYTLNVAADWWTDTGGKWPGITNTGQGDRRSAQAGWGGRLADGTQWSARLERQVHGADPFAASYVNVRPYVYRVNRQTVNGDSAATTGVFAKGTPVTIDEMVELNSIGADGKPVADGRVAIWVNGVCVSVMTGIIFRDNAGADTLPSEVWLDTYEGGTGIQAPHDMGIRYGPLIVSTKLLLYPG